MARDRAAPADQEWDLVLVTIGPCGSPRHAHRHVMTSWLDKLKTFTHALTSSSAMSSADDSI